jgi:hypothetical protein
MSVGLTCEYTEWGALGMGAAVMAFGRRCGKARHNETEEHGDWQDLPEGATVNLETEELELP